MCADLTLQHATGADDSQGSPSAQWLRARVDSTKKKAGQEADHFMHMSAPEPVGATAKIFSQVSDMPFCLQHLLDGCMRHLCALGYVSTVDVVTETRSCVEGKPESGYMTVLPIWDLKPSEHSSAY